MRGGLHAPGPARSRHREGGVREHASTEMGSGIYLLYYKKHFRRKFVCARTCVRARMRKTCKRACSTCACKENANGKVLYLDDGRSEEFS